MCMYVPAFMVGLIPVSSCLFSQARSQPPITQSSDSSAKKASPSSSRKPRDKEKPVKADSKGRKLYTSGCPLTEYIVRVPGKVARLRWAFTWGGPSQAGMR